MPSALQQALVVLAVLAGGCAAEPSVPPAVSLTAGSGLTPKDGIEGLGVAVDIDGSLHVVWQERLDEYRELRGTRLIYRRGTGTPLRWERPVMLGGGAAETGNPHIVATATGVHVFAGEHLHHWWLPAAGRPPRDLGETTAQDGPEVGAFDAVASEDGVLIAFAVPGGSSDEGIYAVRWTPAGPQAPVRIARSSRSYLARPRLFRLGDRWTAVWSNNALVDRPDPTYGMVTTSQSDLRIATSPDGRAWDPPSVLVSPQANIVGIATETVVGEPAIFFASYGLYQSRQRHGTWTPPARIAGFDPGFFSRSTETSAVAVAQCASHTALAWVDVRNRTSDRHWWNPLGGFPWSDNPDWIDNDLFVINPVPRDPDAAAALAPMRLTPPGSMTRDIAIVPRDGQLLVLRTGRARVRKAPYDENAPPEVLLSVVPCG